MCDDKRPPLHPNCILNKKFELNRKRNYEMEINSPSKQIRLEPKNSVKNDNKESNLFTYKSLTSILKKSCQTCGMTDHQRSSSSLCTKNKKNNLNDENKNSNQVVSLLLIYLNHLVYLN
jgi:hypothetical protein